MSLSTLLTAHCLGDVSGSPYEFRNNPSPTNFTGVIEHKIDIWSRFQGNRYGSLGRPTDDTEMTLALCHSLVPIDGGLFQYDPDEAVLSYMKWATQSKMVGRNTRNMFKGITTLRGYNNRKVKHFKGQISQSNGSLMRCVPLLFADDKDSIFYDVCLSNPNLVNLWMGKVYLDLLSLHEKPSKEEFLSYFTQVDLVIPVDLSYETVEVEHILALFIDSDTRNEKINDRKVKGWVVMPLLILCNLFDTLNEDMGLMDFIKLVVHIGGDTDTNAAILAPIFVVWFGEEKLDDKDVIYNLRLIADCDYSGDLGTDEIYKIQNHPYINFP